MDDKELTVVVLTSGKQDRGTRATLAFSWACTALAMGRKVCLYMTMDGTVWAMKDSADGVEVQGFEPLANYIEQFIALGGELMVCAPCSEYFCSFNRSLVSESLRTEAKLVGLSTVVGLTNAHSTLVTF
jgi:predicted peroxiredoxin